MSDNVVSMEQLRRDAATAVPASDTIPEFIKPKSIIDMTDTEADAFLVDLRNRRLRAQQLLKQANEQKAAIASAAARMKIEKKAAMVQRAEERVGAAIEKLEEQLFQLRALILQNE